MARKLIFIDFCQMTHFNDLKSKLFLYHTVELLKMDEWMNGVLGQFYALSRLNWAGDNLG